MFEARQAQHERLGGDLDLLSQPGQPIHHGVDGEGMLGPLLGIGAEGTAVHLVQLAVVGHRAGAGQHPGEDPAVLGLGEHLRARAHHILEVIHPGARVGAGQPGEHHRRLEGNGAAHRGALGEHHLRGPARTDLEHRLLHQRLVFIWGVVRLELELVRSRRGYRGRGEEVAPRPGQRRLLADADNGEEGLAVMHSEQGARHHQRRRTLGGVGIGEAAQRDQPAGAQPHLIIDAGAVSHLAEGGAGGGESVRAGGLHRPGCAQGHHPLTVADPGTADLGRDMLEQVDRILDPLGAHEQDRRGGVGGEGRGRHPRHYATPRPPLAVTRVPWPDAPSRCREVGPWTGNPARGTCGAASGPVPVPVLPEPVPVLPEGASA